MKSKIYSIITIFAIGCCFAACDDHNYGNEPTEEGSISFANFGVDVDNDQSEIETRASVDVSGFLVKIIDTNKNVTVKQSTYGTLPGVVALPVGDYKIMVESHEVQPAEFDHPYYAGETTVKVSANNISDAGKVVCTFSSIRVTIRYENNLKALLGDDVTVTVHANDEGELIFTPDETRSGYFRKLDGSTTLIANLRGTINGNYTEIRKEITDVKAGDHRIITYKVNLPPDFPDESGGIDPSQGINIDTSVETVDKDGNVSGDEENLGSDDRPGQEEPDGPDDPTPPGPPAEDSDVTIKSEDLNLEGDNKTSEVKSAVVNIHAESGLKHLYLEVSSTNEDFSGIALSMFGIGKFDIANPPTEESANNLKVLGLDCGEAIQNKQDVIFDISKFIPMLDNAPGFPGKHIFKLTAVSNKDDEATKSLILIAE